MKRKMKLGLLLSVAFALLCSSATSQAYNENWQEDANGVLDNMWATDPNPSGMIMWANFDQQLELRWSVWDRIHVGVVQNWFTDVRLCGYVNAGGDGDTLATVPADERTWTGLIVHEPGMYLSGGYLGIIRQAADGLYFELGDGWSRGSWDYDPFNAGTPEETSMLIPGTETGSTYDIPYWCVVTAEAWNYNDMGTPADPADDLVDMYVSSGLWLTEEDWLNEVEPIGYYEVDDLAVSYTHSRMFSGVHGRGDGSNLSGPCTWDMLDSYQLNEYSGGIPTAPRGTGGPGLGDGNGDNVVDQADFTTWADNYGNAGGPGDYNGDNMVDQADFTTWADNYGNVYTPTPEGTNAKYTGEYPGEDYGLPPAAVPEPATLMLLGLGGLAAIRRRK